MFIEKGLWDMWYGAKWRLPWLRPKASALRIPLVFGTDSLNEHHLAFIESGCWEIQEVEITHRPSKGDIVKFTLGPVR